MSIKSYHNKLFNVKNLNIEKILTEEEKKIRKEFDLTDGILQWVSINILFIDPIIEISVCFYHEIEDPPIDWGIS